MLLALGASACGGASPPPTALTNRAPRILSAPATASDHNRHWSYTFRAVDDDGDPLSITARAKPPWATWDSASSTLAGLPDWANIGRTSAVEFLVTDGRDSVTQRFNVAVRLGEIDCNIDRGDPATSLYILPFRTGETWPVNQPECPPNPAWGHHNWFALDFELTTGTTVIAARAGVVVSENDQYADGTRICGQENQILIRHDDGSLAGYAHFTTGGSLVTVGQRVEQGEPIGLSGDSGCSIGPHLHFHVYRQVQGPYTRQYTLPLNFRNASGPLDANRALIYLASYTALPVP